MIYTVAEFNLLQIFLKSQKLLVFTGSFIVLIDTFEHLPKGKVIFPVLIPKDIAAGKGRLCEIIHKFFLVERQFLKTGHRVAQHLYVGKTVNHRSRRIVRIKSVSHC